LFAVVQIGGHQYKVVVGDSLTVNPINAVVGSQIRLHKVLLVGGKQFTAIGRPLVSNAVIEATVEEHVDSKRLTVFKKKRRKGYRRWKSVRTPITSLRISKIHFDQPAVDAAKERVVAIE